MLLTAHLRPVGCSLNSGEQDCAKRWAVSTFLCPHSMCTMSDLEVAARFAALLVWARKVVLRGAQPAHAFGCPRACASAHNGLAGSWPRPAHGQTRHWAALPLAPTHIPHPLVTPHRCARHFASLPFDIQEIYGGASGPLAPSGVRFSTRWCAPNGC